MSHETEVATSGDEMIRELVRTESGITYYALGKKITVSHRGGNRFLCHTCVSSEPCCHTRRIARFRNDEACSGVISEKTGGVEL